MVTCPKCGAENGRRTANPVKCCRCWHQFVRHGDKPLEPKKGVGNEGDRTQVNQRNIGGRIAKPGEPRGAEVADKPPTQKPMDRRESGYASGESVSGDKRVGQVEDHPDRPICGFIAFNDNDGEWYTCGLPAHGPKVKHGAWVKQ